MAPAPISRLAHASWLVALAGLMGVVYAYLQQSAAPAVIGAVLSAAAVPMGITALARVAAGNRRGARYALGGVLLGLLVAAPAGWGVWMLLHWRS